MGMKKLSDEWVMQPFAVNLNLNVVYANGFDFGDCPIPYEGMMMYDAFV